jgi:hypothetical protein
MGSLLPSVLGLVILELAAGGLMQNWVIYLLYALILTTMIQLWYDYR